MGLYEKNVVKVIAFPRESLLAGIAGIGIEKKDLQRKRGEAYQ